MDRNLLLTGAVAILLVAACAPVQQAPEPAAGEVVLPGQIPPTGVPPSAAEADAATTAAGNEPAPVRPDEIQPEPVKEAPPARATPAPKIPVTVPTPATAPARVSPPVAVTPKATSPAASAVAPAVTPRQAPPPVAPPLDLAGLESRLRETKAIGVMTKLALKNQVDDLLDRFRSQHRGRSKTPWPELRAAYDRLLMKVLSLLQDGDPALAKKIVSSREAIWGILSDPKKFAENNLMAGA